MSIQPLPLPARSSFAVLPSEILCAIAEDADDISIWRLMAVCRSVRHAVEPALKPYLERRVVTVNPPFVTDMYEVIDENFAKNHLDRRVALRNVSTKFESHLISYPASSSLIRDITIELRDDDDTSNWPILKRLAPQLERLEVHLMDRLWIEGLNIDEYELADNPNRTVSRISANSADVWRRVFDYSSVQFSNLTSITLITTSRIMEHLDGLKRCVPKIIDLTLVSHKCSELDDFVYTPNGLNTDYDNDSSFFDLKALTLSGDSNLCFAADEVVISADALSHLTFHFTDFPVMDTPELFASFLDLTFEEDMWDRMEDTRLVSFSMFGTRTVAFLQAFLEEFTTRKTHPAFWTLTDLYLGQDDLSGELDEESAGWCYPLLQGTWPTLPRLRRVQRITYLEYYKLQKYDEAALLRLFKHYPTLREVRWIDNIPANPYAVNSTTMPS